MKRALILASLPLWSTVAQAQTTRSATSTRQAYGARLDAAAVPSNVNTARLNNRINGRLDTRLSLRIERYRVGQTADPTAAFKARTDDGTRATPVVAPPPQQDGGD